MEMWCPDDMGRDSWDWVGPPAWERACFNSPEWGGGSSPVKTERHQIVLLLLLLCVLLLLLCVVVCCVLRVVLLCCVLCVVCGGVCCLLLVVCCFVIVGGGDVVGVVVVVVVVVSDTCSTVCMSTAVKSCNAVCETNLQVTEQLGVGLLASPPPPRALDNQQLLAIEGSPTNLQKSDKTSENPPKNDAKCVTFLKSPLRRTHQLCR